MEKRRKVLARAGTREDWPPNGGWDDVGADLVDRLRESCRGWAVGSGWDYMTSSPLGMNAPSAVTLSCTAHDIGTYEHFDDWMCSRAAQAAALSVDIRALRGAYMDGRLSRENLATFGRSFGERAVMALYGVDESVQGDKLSGCRTASGDRLYPETVSGILGRVQSGDFDYLDKLAERLDAFNTGWMAAVAAERTGYDFTREHNVGPVAEVHTMYGWTEGDGIRLFSTDMLDRYVAEVNARLSVHDALSGRKQDGPNMIIRDAPDGDPCRAGEFEDNRAAFLKIMDFSSGKTPAGLYVFDGQSVVRAAKDAAEAELEAAKQAAAPGKTPSRRDTRDLDAACGRIYGAGEPGFEPEP